MIRYIVSLLLFLSVNALMAQGWEQVFPGGGQDEITDLARTPDGGFILAGAYNSASRLSLHKTDAEGNLQWVKTFFGSPLGLANSFVVTRDSGYALAGYIGQQGVGNRDFYVVKTDSKGNQLWAKKYGNSLPEEAYDIIELPDGSLVLAGFRRNADGSTDALVIKTDAAGTQLWSKTFGKTGVNEFGNALTLLQNGDIVVAGDYFLNKYDSYVFSISQDGNLKWEYVYEVKNTMGVSDNEFTKSICQTSDGNLILVGLTTTFPPGGSGMLLKISGSGNPNLLWSKAIPNTDFYDVVERPGGNLMVTGLESSSGGLDDLCLYQTDADGNIICNTRVGRGGTDLGAAIVNTPDGGAAAAGFSSPFLDLGGGNSEKQAYLVKMDADCRILTSRLQLEVFYDQNGNCQKEPSEEGLEDWIGIIENKNLVRYVVTNGDGQLDITSDTSTYKIKFLTPNKYWATCDSIVSINIPNFYDTVKINIPVRASETCPRNEIDIQAPVLRRCEDNTYTIRYCNSGTVASTNTRIKITLDPNLTYVSSSISPFQVTPDSILFNVGTLESFECRTFTLTANLNCNDTQTGQTHCVKANIYPDSFCNVGNWNRSILEVRGGCEGDSVVFKVYNRGSNPSQGGHSFVIVEEVILITSPDNPPTFGSIAPGQEQEVWSREATGKTYRFITEQSDNYPGSSVPTAAVEGCKADTSGAISLGYYTMFPEDDTDAFVETDCQESVEADYNIQFFKRGHPKGYNTDHFISPSTELEYLIHFRNDGPDTVNLVTVRDTLSPLLDPGSVLPGAASHPYDFQVYGSGIVQFTLPNLKLIPGSSANTGFVKFRVKQKKNANTDCGTELENRAAIYFDFNAPVITNQTLHIPCEFDTFAIVQTIDIHHPTAKVQVSPNPFSESALFNIQNVFAQSFALDIYDIQGRLLFHQYYSTPTFRLHRSQLPAGTLFYRLAADGRPVASGTLLVH